MAINISNGCGRCSYGGNRGGFEGARACIKSLLDQGSAESRKFYLARKTAWEMLHDRGYNVPKSELNRSLAEFRSEFGDDPEVDRLQMSAAMRSNPSKKIMVIFMGSNDVKKATVRDLYGQILKESLSGLILIRQSKINSYAKDELKSFPFKVEVFEVSEKLHLQEKVIDAKIAELYVNITKHFLMPKHEVLTPEEKQKLLNKYNLEDKQLPYMLQTDAVARYYGLEKGQLVKITYSKKFVPLQHYRCVV